ncbi:MAG: ABC transporter permease [Gemmatimonadota bacterium]
MPRWISSLISRFRALRHRDRLERELDDEVRTHVEMETEDIVRTRGLPPVEARRQALIAFGGVEHFKEAHRDARGTRWIEELGQDLRYAVRSLLNAPSFSASATLVLALGIGACTAVFTAVDAVLLSGLPYPHDDRLVTLYEQNSPTNRFGLSVADFQGIQAHQRTLSSVGAVRYRQVPISAGGEATRGQAAWVTSGLFRALDVRADFGRVIEPADDQVGAPPVTLVSRSFAARAFGDPARAVGRSLMIDGTSNTVIGVLPVGVTTNLRADIWPVLQLKTPERRGPFGYRVVGRLADGVTLEAAQRDLAGVSRRIFPIWAASFHDSTALITPVSLRTAMLGDAGQTLSVFIVAVVLVLLISMANVASLMLVRASGRAREVGLRTALGATRGRLVRLLVTESILLALVGSIAGVALGALGLNVLSMFGAAIPQLHEARLGFRAVMFALGIAVISGLVVGAAPVAFLLRPGMQARLGSGDREVGGGRRAELLRGAFVVAEFALALPLLAAAGLLLGSFLKLERVSPGFDPSRVLSVHVSLPSVRYPGDSAISGFWARALPRIRELPGIVSAGLGDAVPPLDQVDENNFDLLDRPVPAGQAQPTSPWPTVTAEYFTSLGVPVLAGRSFTPADSATAPPTVVVSQAWARHYFPEGHVVGRRMISGGCTSCPPTTVVGVVGDIKYVGLAGTNEAVYNPVTQNWYREMNVFVRTAAPPAEAVERVRAVLRSVDPDVPLEDAAPIEERLSGSLEQHRHLTTLLGGFAIVALALAAVGIFGMLSYTVRARHREIGVRMALGAHRTAVVGMIVRNGMAQAALGAVVGLGAAVAGTRWIQSQLFDTSPTDLPTLSLVTLLLLGAALAACWLPARRAAAIDPVEAIRAE